MGTEIFHNLKKVLHDRGLSTAVGDEGGFAPTLEGTEDALDSIKTAVEKAGYKFGDEVMIALDCAAAEFFEDGKYNYKKFEGEGGEERREYYRQRAKEWKKSGIGLYTEEAKQKRHETYYKNGYNMETFTVISPWGETFTEKGIKPFCRKMNISHTSLSSVIHGRAYMVHGWHLPGTDPILPLKLFREGKTKKEVGDIIGVEIKTQVTHLFPLPKEGHKWCPCCFQELPLDEFHDNINSNGSKTKRSDCKNCNLKRQREARKNK